MLEDSAPAPSTQVAEPPGDDRERSGEMHPYTIERMARDHMQTLDREAQRAHLADTARAGRVVRHDRIGLLPARPGRGRLGRAMALLLKAASA